MSPTAAPGSRVGWGIDAHPFNDRPPLLLGGVPVSDELGADATSDGDVLAHAVIDALLGACVMGDIGEHFPSSDPNTAGADSMEMLRTVTGAATRAGWRVSHVDVTVVSDRARVGPQRAAIRAALAEALGVEVAVVSVKGTGTDGLGFSGRGEGILATALVTVEPR